MTSLFRKFTWWMQRRRMERQLHEELQFHLSEEADERQAIGLPADQARLAARLDLGNPTLVQEDARTLWTWIALEQLGQDVRYGLRTMFKNRMFTALAALSLALGIGANTAIYSFMDSILLRSLPVLDPASLVVVKWRSKPYTFSKSREFVMRSADGSTYRDPEGITAAIFPFPAFERLQEASVYVPYAQLPPRQLRQMTYALRTDGDPLRYVAAVRQIVREADGRVPVTNIKTQAADIDQTINQEIVFARLCSAFAVLALVIACVGLYATMAYTVARRTNEIGLRMALGAPRGRVIWMVLREVCVLVAIGLAIGLPTAFSTSRFVESFLFDMKPNDPSALALAASVLLGAALLAGYGPARRASRVDPMVALRHE